MNFLKYIITMILLLFLGIIILYFQQPEQLSKISHTKITIPNLASSGAISFYSGALKQVGVVNKYDFSNGYYGNGGYPPDDIGVCSDVIWRAFLTVGVDFKNLIDDDIKQNEDFYNTNFDSNINFRRVKNINTYFLKNSKILTNELIPNNVKNLIEWQVGDIVIFDELPPKKLWHIGIISDLRREDGIPYMLDNHGYGVDIRITPLDWPTKIIGHYRYFLN